MGKCSRFSRHGATVAFGEVSDGRRARYLPEKAQTGPSPMRVWRSAARSKRTPVGMMPIAHSRLWRASVFAIVARRQEVRPMNAVSAVGAPLQSTIARLR
jgi:hypothetical protein